MCPAAMTISLLRETESEQDNEKENRIKEGIDWHSDNENPTLMLTQDSGKGRGGETGSVPFAPC